MPLDHNTLQAWQRKQMAQVDAALHPQRQAVASVGRTMQQVLDHPGWQAFAEHIDAMVAQLVEERARKVAAMLAGDELGPAVDVLKLQIRGLDGQVKGLQQALALVPELIKRGQQLAEELSARPA